MQLHASTKESMFGAILVGLVIGVACFAPLVFGMNKARNATPTSNLGHAGSLLLGVLISFVVLGGAMVLCALFFRDVAIPFVLAEAAGLAATAIAFGISKNLRR